MNKMISIIFTLVLFNIAAYGQDCWPPHLTNAPVSISESHCNTVLFDFDAVPDTSNPTGNPITFGSNIGSIDVSTGEWSYDPSPEDVNSPPELIIYAYSDTCYDSAVVTLDFTNNAPEITNCPGPQLYVLGISLVKIQLQAEDLDACDDLTWSMYGSSAWIDSLTGELTILGNYGEASLDILVSDGI